MQKYDFGSVRKLCWRFFLLLTLAGGLVFVTTPRTARADACLDNYNMCVSLCAGDLSCLYSCEQSYAWAGCFSDGNQEKCDTLYSACRNMGGLGGGTEEADCFSDYANCEGAVATQARAGYVMLHGMPLETDDPCLVAARDEYWACMDGSNEMCVSQVDFFAVSGCCNGERERAFAACNGYSGP